MNRRALLTSVTALSVAGCVGGDDDREQSTGSDTSTPTSASSSDSATPTQTEEQTATATGTPAPASFEVVRMEGPSKVEIGEPFAFEITVKNTGEQPGTLRADLYSKTPDSQWERGVEWEIGPVDGGETATVASEKASIDHLTKATYRLGTSDITYTVQTVSKSLSWGQTYTSPENFTISVDNLTLQESYEYRNFADEVDDARPEAGSDQWAFIDVTVTNDSGEPGFSPVSSDFVILAGNSQYNSESVVFDDPINKGTPFEGGELQPGVTRSGWVLYSVPLSIAPEDMTVAWSKSTFDGDISVNWSGDPDSPGD